MSDFSSWSVEVESRGGTDDVMLDSPNFVSPAAMALRERSWVRAWRLIEGRA